MTYHAYIDGRYKGDVQGNTEEEARLNAFHQWTVPNNSELELIKAW